MIDVDKNPPMARKAAIENPRNIEAIISMEIDRNIRIIWR
jgi:hypothetical protein